MSTLVTNNRAGAVHPASFAVPWLTVLTLAAAMSCACGFWLVSLQGAIGATDRTGTPFATSLMLAAVLLPLFGALVLGALTLAKRWFGPVPQGLAQVATSALLVVAAGTLLGLAAILASSLYDYSLQLHHIEIGMAGMSPCTGACVPREQHAIFVLHVRGVLLVGRWLLLTNLVLVAWLVAMWGGRIRLAASSIRSTGDSADEAADRATAGGDFASYVRLLLVGMLFGAGVIHAAVIPEHLEEWSAAGRFFIALTVAELAVAVLLAARFRERAVLHAAGVLSAVPLVAWLWSRTLGLPFGPEAGIPEALGVPDVLACALEVGALLAVLALLTPGRLVGRPPSAHSRGLAVLALVAVTAIGFAATGTTWFDAFGVSAAHSTMEMPQ